MAAIVDELVEKGGFTVTDVDIIDDDEADEENEDEAYEAIFERAKDLAESFCEIVNGGKPVFISAEEIDDEEDCGCD